MNFVHKIRCLALALTMLAVCAGCGGDATSSTGSSSAGETTHREPYESSEAVYEDNDHLFDYKSEKWDGPEGYVIVVPAGNSEARETAEILRTYYSEDLGVTLSIVTDNVAESDKEILIGKTSRKESTSDMKEAGLKVSVQGSKLVFDGGHNVTVDSAVKKFVRLAPEKGEAFTFELTSDFVSTLDGGYEYVWGDEFEGEGLDPKNWDLISKMNGNEVVELSKDKEVVDVADGRLKLHAISYFNNDKEGVEYRVPCSVVTQNKMNYVYGYLEIRSRVPYSKGVWASFWTQSTDALKGTRNYDYMLEVDIYEIFRTYQKTPNLIHWYTAEFDYNSRYPEWEPGATKGIATSNATYLVGSNPNVYEFEPSDSLNYEYHIYGYEWTPTEIKMYVDGYCHVTYDITKSFDAHQDVSSYHDPQHVIFNNHLFYPGVSEACVSIANAPESLPACHYIDYIRLYQKPGVGELYTAD